MDKVGYPRGLVKYSTQHAIDQHWSFAQTLKHVLRPRVLIYTAILGAVTVTMMVSLALRPPFKVDVVRDRGALARIAEGGNIENVYRLQIMNTTESDQHLRISVEGLPGLRVVSSDGAQVGPAQSRWVAVNVQLPYEAAASGSHPIHFRIASQVTADAVTEKSVFIVPR
jgi:polyferredoxin